MKQILTLAAAVALIFSHPVGASLAQSLTTEEIIKQLSPPAKTRSLKPLRGITIEGIQREELDASVNLYINFEFNSAELKQDALITLNQLAAALKDEKLARLDFLIGGHTDAVGSDEYNNKLSEQRAKSVKHYLVTNSGIESHRLLEKGFGERRLLDPEQPLDGANRRVQIITLATPSQ